MEIRNKKQFYFVSFGVGVLGAAAMSLLMALARGMGLTQMNLEMMLGTMLASPSGGTRFLGFVWHLINGGIFALIYAAGFKALGRASASLGLGFGTIHWVVAGVFMGMVPLMHPMIPEMMAPPGYFGVNGGAFDFVAELMLHWVYGGIVGYGCSRVAGASAFLRGERDRQKPQDLRHAA